MRYVAILMATTIYALLGVAAACNAQTPEQVGELMQDAPTPQVFTRADLALLAADTGIRLTDAFQTRHFLTHGGREYLLPDFITRSTPRMVTYSLAVVGVDAGVMYLLNKHGHRRLSRTYILAEIGNDGMCVGISFVK